MAVDSTKYSLYAQRDLEKQYVNWGQVAKDVTAGITTIAGERKARKDALDNLTNEAMENLSAVPDVQSQNAGALIINASDMSKKNLQIQYDLMKRGLISTKDFQLFLQQQKNDYSSYSTSIKNWDGWYQKSLDKINKGEAAADELYNMVSLEGFGNLQDKALLTNPANGRLQLVQMDEDNDGNYTITPDAQTNPEKFISPHGINMRMNLQSKKKVLTDEVKALVDPLGQFIRQEIGATGTSVTKEGLVYAEKGTYDEFIKSSVDSLTATNNDQMQILAGQGYQIAQSEAEFKKLYGEDADLNKWIKLEYKKGIPTYSLNGGKIDEKSKEIAKNAIDQQLDDVFKEDKQVSSSFSSSAADRANLKLGEDRIKTIGEIYSNKDPEMVKRAIKSLLTTSDDRFAEFDQKTVKLTDGREIVTEIIVPYIDSDSGNKISKPIVFHELKEGAKKGSKDPKDYVAVSPDQFSKGMYEMISMADARYVPYSEVQKYVDNDLIINPTGNKSYKPIIESLIDPREGITIASKLKSGNKETTVKAIYSEALVGITGADYLINKTQVAALADSLNEALRGAAVVKGDDAAANRVSITAEGADKIIVKVDGKVTKTISIPDASFDARQETLEGEIDTIMNELLTTILPKIEGGYEDDTSADDGTLG